MLVKIEVNPKRQVVGKTYRLRNSKVLDDKGSPSWADITAPTPAAALAHLGWKAEDIDIAKVWKCSGKVGESGQPTSGGWGKLILPAAILDKKEKAAAQRANLRDRKEQERHDAYEKQCRDNEAKGLTWAGYTKTFDGESIDLYINNKKMVCTVSYDCCASPHMEFKGEPCMLTETGYRSHFLQVDLKEYESLREAVEDQVRVIIRQEKKKGGKYILTWEPSLEYMKYLPNHQLNLFNLKEVARH